MAVRRFQNFKLPIQGTIQFPKPWSSSSSICTGEEVVKHQEVGSIGVVYKILYTIA